MELLKEGYLTYTGYKLTGSEAELLNKYYSELEKHPKDLLLADNCHKMYQSIALQNMFLGDKKTCIYS